MTLTAGISVIQCAPRGRCRSDCAHRARARVRVYVYVFHSKGKDLAVRHARARGCSLRLLKCRFMLFQMRSNVYAAF